MSKVIDIEDYKGYIDQSLIIRFKGILFQPVKMKHYKEFMENIHIITMDKNSLGDMDLVRMSELNFLAHMCAIQESYMMNFAKIMSLVTNYNKNDISFLLEEDKFYLRIDEVLFDKKDYESIKKLICYQNIYKFSDEYIDPTFKEAIDEANELASKNMTDMTLADQISALQVLTSYTDNEIMDMSLLEFYGLYSKSMSHDNYLIMMNAKMSHGAEFKEKIDHWAFSSKEGKYDSIISDIDSLGDMVGDENIDMISNSIN